MNTFFYVIYPYVCLSIMACGLPLRYLYAPGQWNARSSQFFERRLLLWGSTMFHVGILLSLGGHVVGAAHSLITVCQNGHLTRTACARGFCGRAGSGTAGSDGPRAADLPPPVPAPPCAAPPRRVTGWLWPWSAWQPLLGAIRSLWPMSRPSTP